MHARALIEQRFGPLGCGEQSVNINGACHDVADLLFRMGLNFDDAKPVDVQATTPGRYVLRYFDGADSHIVACEFDVNLNVISEIRAHIAEWVGDDAYFSFYAGH
jgi:hypothetical protein